MNTVLQRVVKPSNCGLVFGIPTGGDFVSSRLSSHLSAFAKSYSKLEYDDVVLKPYKATIGILEKKRGFGLNVVHRATLEDFGDCFQGRFDVIILFSHWQDDRVELWDDFYSPETVADRIPASFSGLVDLCVCQPSGLPEAIKRKAPNSFVRYSERKVNARVWLRFYMLLFRLLAEGELTYLGAFLLAMKYLLKDGKASQEKTL